MAKRKTKKNSRVASFDGVGKSFAANQEYLVEVKEAEVDESTNGNLMISLKLEGTGEFKGSIMYHNASLADSALWKTRDVFEAFLGDVPEGDFDVDEEAEKFVGKKAMCDTYADTYEDKTRIKPQNFWASEGHDEDGGEEAEIDLDEIDDADIKKLGKELKIKSKRASTIREQLAEEDEDDLMAALVKLGLVEADEEEADEDEDEDGIDLDEMSDEDILAIGKAAGIKGKKASTVKKKLEALDDDDLAEAVEEAGVGGDSAGGVTADDIGAMNQEELEAFVEEHELDVDLDDIKTLRKKRVAVIDAAEEEELLTED